jgi:hypothetical protein
MVMCEALPSADGLRYKRHVQILDAIYYMLVEEIRFSPFICTFFFFQSLTHIPGQILRISGFTVFLVICPNLPEGNIQHFLMYMFIYKMALKFKP